MFYDCRTSITKTSTKNSKTNVGHVVLSVLISSTFLLAIVTENQNLFALTSGDRYNSGFSHGQQQAAIDFQNNIPFNPVCVEHTGYYCASYFKGYNVTWNNLAAKGHTSNPSPNPPASNSTSPLPPTSNTVTNPSTTTSNTTTGPLPTTSNTNTTAINPSSIISPSTDSWVVPFVIFVIVVLIIAAVWKLKHRGGKYKERHHFPDPVKEKVLEKQHHRCAVLLKLLYRLPLYCATQSY